MVLGALFVIYALNTRYERMKARYDHLVVEINTKSAIKAAENALKLAQALLEAEKTTSVHLKETTAILLNFDGLLKKAKAENETLEITNDMLNAERNRLRNAVASIDLRLPEGDSRPSDIATSQSNCDATIIRACQITTLDYNALREAFDTNCKLTGCE
jgi:hypothetical protein